MVFSERTKALPFNRRRSQIVEADEVVSLLGAFGFLCHRIGQKSCKLFLANGLRKSVVSRDSTNKVRHREVAALTADQFTQATWTFAILEELKDKAQTVQVGRLRNVLESAMPLVVDFSLFLNGQEIESSKKVYDKVVDFAIHELPTERLNNLTKSTGFVWRVEGERLLSQLFKNGISGRVIVTEKSLAGKSDDLFRSHGFFVRVRGRLVNEDDPNFGITSAYGTMNRFRADLDVDDLNTVLTASREGIEDSDLSRVLRQVLTEIFNEARQRYEDYHDKQKAVDSREKEVHRNYVSPRFVEHPIADAIGVPSAGQTGAEPDKTWFYIDVPSSADISSTIQRLYHDPRTKYSYLYSQGGKNERLVRFDPAKAVFIINIDHEFARAHIDEPRARLLLEDFVTTETMLEVYLREASIPATTIGQVLERRDGLLRSLALDHPFSLPGIAAALLDSAGNERDLEINLIAAARALGFVAKHVSGEGQPDGLAEFIDYPLGPRVIALEAKSSKDVPSLSAIDFAGLHQHVNDHQADGCLLVAPDYPGRNRADVSAAAKRARDLRISCWTVQQLADFVKAAETKHLNARHLLDIVLSHFAPDDVTAAIKNLLSTTPWEMPQLYSAVISAFKDLEGRLSDAPRTIGAIATEVSRQGEFRTIKQEQIRAAVISLAQASKGAMTVRDDTILLHVSTAELERRVGSLTSYTGQARRISNFREGPKRLGES